MPKVNLILSSVEALFMAGRGIIGFYRSRPSGGHLNAKLVQIMEK